MLEKGGGKGSKPQELSVKLCRHVGKRDLRHHLFDSATCVKFLLGLKAVKLEGNIDTTY